MTACQHLHPVDVVDPAPEIIRPAVKSPLCNDPGKGMCRWKMLMAAKACHDRRDVDRRKRVYRIDKPELQRMKAIRTTVILAAAIFLRAIAVFALCATPRAPQQEMPIDTAAPRRASCSIAW
jgi:hypothetical protein